VKNSSRLGGRRKKAEKGKTGGGGQEIGGRRDHTSHIKNNRTSQVKITLQDTAAIAKKRKGKKKHWGKRRGEERGKHNLVPQGDFGD